MKNSKQTSATLIFLAVVIMAALINVIKADIACNDAVTKLFPRELFLIGATAGPSATCCTGAHELEKIARSSIRNRRALCKCFKSIAHSLPLNLGNAKKIPKLCKLTINIPIDPTVNCNVI